MATSYRGLQEDNRNTIINNNTALRIFNVNKHINGEIHPFTDTNIEGNKPKNALITYKADNVGILKRNKSQHLRNAYTQE